MRTTSSQAMVAAGIAVLLFTACSSPEAPAPALSATQTFDAAGVVGASHRHTTSPNAVSGIFRKIHPGPAELAVSDFGTNSVEILNKSFQPVAAITQKIRSADGIHYDAKGNLYVANSTGPFVTEYNPSRKLIFTYSAGLSAAVDVTVDASGNVFVADFGPNVPSVVVEYAQRRKPPTATCSTGLANDGIAVDPNGNVFVSGFDVNAHIGRLLEYRGGLAGCQAMTLAPTMATAGGLQFDAHRNLLACDQDAGVDVIPRPYTVIARTIASLCFHEVLNKRQNRLYIAEPNTNDVLVDTYPAGTTLEKLGSANGLTEPGGVAAFPNAP